ncbi:MAG: hypothetical protein JO122_02445 [Acetobacteraceae bacterium]|nr:hypothetical protein [Acetobacteraceae bacterium]
MPLNATARRAIRAYLDTRSAATIGITPQIIFDWLRKGLLSGEQLAKGLSPEQAAELATQVRRTSRSGSEAS